MKSNSLLIASILFLCGCGALDLQKDEDKGEEEKPKMCSTARSCPERQFISLKPGDYDDFKFIDSTGKKIDFKQSSVSIEDNGNVKVEYLNGKGLRVVAKFSRIFPKD